MRFPIRRHVQAVIAALALLLALVPAASAALDSKGTDFWLAFPQNFGDPEHQLSLFITGSTATTGTVAMPGIGFTAPFTVTPGAVTTVVVPLTAQVTSADGVEHKGIHVTALAEVTVYGLNRAQTTTDAYLGLPTDILGTEYVVLGYQNVDVVNGNQLTVVGTQNATTVTITPRVTVGARAAGAPYNIVLNQGQTYQLQDRNAAPSDLSGSIITSDKPVAVFGGHLCANIPPGRVFCDHIVEQLTPTSTWGRSFVTMPLATRTGGDTFRFLASTNGTTVSINGAPVATLNRGQFHEQIVTGPAHITSNNPILVAQYSNSTSFDNVTSDPFMMLIPPFEQFLASYTVTTPASGFRFNFINVVVPNAAVGAVTLDGTPIPSSHYTPIGSSGFSGTQEAVSLGTHNLAGPLPFGTFVYGFDEADSYGYPGGMALGEVARATSVTLAPKTATNPVGSQHCVIATVKDQNGIPLAGVRVDFAVTGVNPTTGFQSTDSAGQAQFCYSGANAGTDSIKASVGTLSDTAAKTWTATVSHVLTVARQGGGSGRVAGSPAGIDCGADCSEAYADGTRVTLTATPASGSAFAGWGGACAAAGASPTCGLTVAKDEVVTARFDRANVGVAVGRLPGIAPSSDPILLATLTARDGCGPFDRIEFGNLGRSFDNARIGILSPPGWPENQTVGFVYTPPPGTTTVSFGFQRIMQHGGATVSPIRLHDGCGVWITLVGGGPDAFR